jgi:hypothetical protein
LVTPFRYMRNVTLSDQRKSGLECDVAGGYSLAHLFDLSRFFRGCDGHQG